MKVIWSPLAIDKVSAIVEYIARDKPGAAQAWAEGIFEIVAPLARFPNQGRMVPELRRESVREIIYGGYRVIYRIEADRISILTVRHGRQLFDPSEVPD